MVSAVRTLVIGGGLRGLRTALTHLPCAGGGTVRCIEAQPWPGDDVRSQRSNGFVCELGPFAFPPESLRRLVAPLSRPPKVVTAQVRDGSVFDGERHTATTLDVLPCSFATGCEEVVQAYRRELGDVLMLGRAVTRIEPQRDGFTVVLGGEVETRMTAAQVVLAISPIAAAGVLGHFDPELVTLHELAERDRRAFVWFGGLRQDAPELTGYGVLAADGLETATRELIYCDRVFANRALDGRCLVRAELTLDATDGDDRELAARAAADLRRFTGTRARFGFVKVHRFETFAHGGVFAECHARIADLAARLPGLSVAG